MSHEHEQGEVSTGVRQAGIKLIVYRETKPGDLRKFRATANDASSGGGARDLRYRPEGRLSHEPPGFWPVFERLFTGRETRTTSRLKPGLPRAKGNYERVINDVLVGPVKWVEGDSVRSRQAVIWPKTDAKARNELRWATVYQFWPFQQSIPENEGHIITLLVQDNNDDVWLRVETEKELRSGRWNRSVVDLIFACIDAKTEEDHAAAGYIDFVRGKRFCNAS